MNARFSPVLGLIAILSCASAASAYDHVVDGEQTYRLQGAHSQRGAFESKIVLTPTKDGVEVTRTEGDSVLRGTGQLRGDQLRVSLAVYRGAAKALQRVGEDAEPVELRLRFGEDGSLESRFKDASGTATAKGKQDSKADDDDDDDDDDGKLRGKVKQAGKHLVALGKKELEKLAYKGAAIEQTFKVSDYLHLGVGVELRALDPDKQTALQKATAAAAAERSAWLVTEIEGGVKVPLSASIPVGGAVTLGLGFQAGAKVNYAVTHLYELPDGLDVSDTVDLLKDLGKRSYDLPLDWAEAAALDPGSRAVLEGEATLAANGNLRIGHHVTDFGDNVVRVGASARLGGFYRVSGNLRFEVYRLAKSEVRLRILRSKKRSRGVSADLFLGASVDRGEASDRIEPSVDYFDNALLRKVRDAAVDAAVDEVADRVERALRVKISAGASNSTRDDVNISYRFDLSVAAAQGAYDRAIRGDLRLAESLRRDSASGVVREYRVLEAAEAQHMAVNLNLSVLLGAGAKRTVTIKDLDVEEGNDAKVHYDLFTFNRRRYLSLIGKKLKLEEHRSREVTIDVVRKTLASGEFARSFRFTYSVVDPFTTKGEGDDLRRLVRYWKLSDETNQPKHKFRLFRSRYGETKTKISVDVSEEGLQRILTVSDITQFMAYIESYQAVYGETPVWADPEKREELREDWADNDQNEDRQRAELDRAEDFVVDLQKLASTENADERALQLKKLAKNARYSLMGIATLVRLAPREALSVQVSMNGERIQVGDSWEGARSSGPLRVGDPR
jgi:hypothetical protein